MKKFLVALGMGLILMVTSSFNLDMSEVEEIRVENSYVDNVMLPTTSWLASDNGVADYGKGRFYYRLYRSQYPVDMSGNYKFEIHFISDSYYPRYMYDENVYRAATKIDKMDLFVNNNPYINSIYNSPSFWIVFEGNYENGIGDVGVVFYHPSASPNVYITWTEPKPF